MVNCKVDEQSGGYAPKSIVLQALPLQKWVHMLRKEEAPADFCPSLPAPGWLCSDFCTYDVALSHIGQESMATAARGTGQMRKA